ncbi:fumarate hydratase [Chloroflexota bacterium]
MTREIQAKDITHAVARLFIEANYELPPDVVAGLESALGQEVSQAGRAVLESILENASLARPQTVPLCQDCGSAVVFLEIGQEVHITGGGLHQAITEGVRRAYDEGYLRKSIVANPFSSRQNTGDNTPPFIHTEIVPGDSLKIAAMPKGGGADNMSCLAVLSPMAGADGVVDFVVKTVSEAGANPCPPLVVGVGIGGTVESVMILAKKALLRSVGSENPNPETAALEAEILRRINGLGIGPMGFGGSITALAVHAEIAPTHIASLPVGVNFQCHSARHKEAIL